MKEPRSLGVRIALTVAPLLALGFAASRLLLPGVGSDATMRKINETSPIPLGLNVGVFALGVGPFLYAYIFVELAALAIPRWRSLRHGNPEGRAKLDRAARVVGLLLAAFQAFGMTMSLRALFSADYLGNIDTPTISVPVVTATLVGGACVTLLVSDFVTRQGIVNGLLSVFSIEQVLRHVYGLRDGYAKATIAGTWETKHTVVIAGATLVAVVAVWIVVRDANDIRTAKTRDNEKTAYRDARALAVRAWVPIPSSSIVPYTLAASLLGLPAAFASATGPMRDVANALVERNVHAVACAVLVVVLVVVLTRALHRPAEAEDLARRLGTAIDAKRIARAQKRALLPTLLFFAALYVADVALGRVPSLFVSLGALPILTAIAIDGVRAMRTPSDFVGVWQERRSASIPILRAVLEARGIDTRVTGAGTNVMLQSFGPYAPATLLVPSAHAERATKILRHLLLGEDAPPTEAGDERTPAETKPWPRRKRLVALVATLAFACGLLGITFLKSAYDGPRTPAKLEVLAVADHVDAFATIPDKEIPDGIDIRSENVPLGLDERGQKTTERVHFASVSLRDGERIGDAIRRGDAFIKTIRLPAGMRFAWEPTYDWNDDTGALTPTGARTFILVGDAILTNSDVVDATAAVDTRAGAPDVYVAITLTRLAGERFGEVTAERVNRRIAILLDGVINSAPVVRTAITGGRISITMGQGDTEKMLKEARALAGGLTQSIPK